MDQNSPTCDMNMLINVLTNGNEQMKELLGQLNEPSCSAEACKLLATKVRSAFASALSMAKLMEPQCHRPTGFDSPSSVGDSQRSDGSEKAFKELERREMCKKRKTLPRWSNQVQAGSGSMEGPLDDGHSWRKYGQKDILGANFPRAYYRCTYRHTHGCLATKQVQRSEDNPSLFDITYRGVHSCNLGLQRNPGSSPKEESLNQSQAPKQPTHHHQQYQQQQQLLLLEHFRTDLRVKTKGLSSDDHLMGYSPSFSFPSTPASCTKPENQFLGNYSPTFVSTTTSVESNYFSLSPCGVENYGGGFNLMSGLDTEIAEIISAATSTASSPMLGMDFPLEQIEFETDFPFGFS